jgi:hypothetical protein
MKASSESIPNIEFSFAVSDIADPSHLNRTIWALTRLPQEEEKWLMSDFGYWSWPLKLLGSYDQIREEICLKEPAWKDKIDKAVWRGAAKTNVLRKSLLAVTKGKPWSDVKEIFWKNSEALVSGSKSLALSMPEHCKYRYLVQTEGMYRPISFSNISLTSFAYALPLRDSFTWFSRTTINIWSL